MQKESQSVARIQMVKSYWTSRAAFYSLHIPWEGSVPTAILKIL